ncbi:neutral zinc metallopeptidase [Sphingomonas sp. ASV193]|uniref:KPN_02809 family neutral zinc metallopeptidase n=1 Tax=Sphingomonas sp. ASV193 TaxID=3144405 RepID=UPI0032E89000
MRLDGPESSNIEDDTGRSGGMSLGGGGGGLIMMLLQLVASRFGIVGIIVLALGYCALQSLGGGAGPTIGGNGGKSTLDPATKTTLAKILGSTEQVWGQVFQQAGSTYTPTTLAIYDRSYQSGCGAAQSAMGPFYCPTDKKIYLDPEFFNELSTKFNAPGDFPDGYVIAHEVGHHIQDLEGTLDKAQQAQGSLGQAAGNKVQVGIELQADCYAGVWAKRSGVMEAGDLEEGLRAAQAIGDDTLQKETQGQVVPDSFTHGTSAQRMEALKTGATTGDPASCAKYTQGGY